MVSTFTTARSLEKPAAGDQVGTWGTASVNPNMDVIDAGMGQQVLISVSGGDVVLSAAQFRCRCLVFNSTLVGSINVTFPTSFYGSYLIKHIATGSSAFTITLKTSGGTAFVCPPPRDFVEVFNDGIGNIEFKSLGHVGGYWDYAGSSVPNWVSGCSIPPYLNCDGTAFSSATYPTLAVILGGTTLPDFRGRYPAYNNQGTGRITSAGGGVDGNTLGAAGGAQTTTLSSQNIPPVPVTVNDPGHTHNVNLTFNLNNRYSGAGADLFGDGTQAIAQSNTTGITVTAGSTSPTAFSNLPPTAIGGLRLIRAA